jgi:hypothetical protein
LVQSFNNSDESSETTNNMSSFSRNSIMSLRDSADVGFESAFSD